MYVDMNYGSTKVGLAPAHIEIYDRWSEYGHVTLSFGTVDEYDEHIRVLQENRPAVVKMLTREPVDGCICGQPDLPSFDHAKGCPRRKGEVAA